MSARVDLLPDSAAHFERELARLSASLEDLDPSAIETLWDAWRIPAPLLPWLAWALSVDLWDDAWDEVRKRQAIAASPDYHRFKGTRSAVDLAMALLQRPIEIVEWFEQLPAARRGTARIHIEAYNLFEVADLVRRGKLLASTSKPKSRAVFVGAGQTASGEFVVGAGIMGDTVTTVQPYSYTGETLPHTIVIGGALMRDSLITIQPSSYVGEEVATDFVVGAAIFKQTLTTVQAA